VLIVKPNTIRPRPRSAGHRISLAFGSSRMATAQASQSRAAAKRQMCLWRAARRRPSDSHRRPPHFSVGVAVTKTVPIRVFVTHGAGGLSAPSVRPRRRSRRAARGHCCGHSRPAGQPGRRASTRSEWSKDAEQLIGGRLSLAKPDPPFLAPQDHRHPIMDRPTEPVGRRGEDREDREDGRPRIRGSASAPTTRQRSANEIAMRTRPARSSFRFFPMGTRIRFPRMGPARIRHPPLFRAPTLFHQGNAIDHARAGTR
jgi:hypothetical protein